MIYFNAPECASTTPPPIPDPETGESRVSNTLPPSCSVRVHEKYSDGGRELERESDRKAKRVELHLNQFWTGKCF